MIKFAINSKEKEKKKTELWRDLKEAIKKVWIIIIIITRIIKSELVLKRNDNKIKNNKKH